MSTGERIRLIRMGLGFSQQDLATQIGVAKAMVGQWEIGNRDPKVPALIALADALGCSFTWLATGGGDPRNADQPNVQLIEACVEVALSMMDAEDIPARAAELYCRACEAGFGVRKATREDCVDMVRTMLEAT